MKKKHIFTLFFSLVSLLLSAQKPSDSSQVKKWTYEPNFMVGVDVLSLGTSFSSERKVYQGFVSSRITRNIHLVADAGFEKNIYDKNNYNAEAKGFFLKAGSFYMLAQDAENALNGFYAGGKLGGAFYNQEYFAVPVRGFEGGDYREAFPKSSQTSLWVEATVGGRVQLFESSFFIDVNIQPRYLVFTTRQDSIFPMIVPGFGKSSGKFNMGFSWNIAYKF